MDQSCVESLYFVNEFMLAPAVMDFSGVSFFFEDFWSSLHFSFFYLKTERGEGLAVTLSRDIQLQVVLKYHVSHAIFLKESLFDPGMALCTLIKRN